MKRYQVTIQHEVIIYSEDEQRAVNALERNPEMKLRHNLQVIGIKEIPLPEHEPSQPIIDERTAPGS